VPFSFGFSSHAKTLRWLLSVAKVKRKEHKVIDVNYQRFAFSA